MSGAGRTGAARLNLYEALLRESYDHGVICTFEFDPAFFEQDCLDSLRALSHNGNLSVLLDRSTYDEVARLPGAERPTQANLRYLLHPVSVPGVFHPKIFLFVSRTMGRLIFGSSNFTRRGLYSNAELVGCYDFEVDEDESLLPLFRSVYDFLTKVAARWPGEAFCSNLKAMAAEAGWLMPVEEPPGGPEYEFLHNLEEPLWDQIAYRVPGAAKTVSIVSRYFDKSPAILDRVYETLTPDKIRIYTQNSTTTLTREYLDHPLVREGVAEIFLCVYEDDDQHQDLHAKAVAVESGNEILLAFGSANFSTPALMRSAGAGNVEAMLLLHGLSRKRFKPERLFDPGRTAVRLVEAEALQTVVREPKPSLEPNTIKLFEANLSEKSVRLRAQMPGDVSFEQAVALFNLPDDSQVSIPLEGTQEGEFAGAVSDELFLKVTEAATVVKIEALKGGAVVAASNNIFVTYLQDMKTGRSLRHERLLQEARQSPARFSEVFRSMLEEGDDEAAKNFLDSIDIKVSDLPVPDVFRAFGPISEQSPALMVIRGRGWQISESVHDAVKRFFERHLKRLRRHVNGGSPAGIPNFMQILLTTAVVIETQIARVVGGLSDRGEEPLLPEEWGECRRRLESYYLRHRELLEILSQDFLRPMLRRGQGTKVRELITPEVEQLQILHDRVLKLHAELEEIRTRTLRVRRAGGALGSPSFFPADLLGEKQWARYERGLESYMLTVIESAR